MLRRINEPAWYCMNYADVFFIHFFLVRFSSTGVLCRCSSLVEQVTSFPQAGIFDVFAYDAWNACIKRERKVSKADYHARQSRGWWCFLWHYALISLSLLYQLQQVVAGSQILGLNMRLGGGAVVLASRGRV